MSHNGESVRATAPDVHGDRATRASDRDPQEYPAGARLVDVAGLAADVVARHDPADPFDERREGAADAAIDAQFDQFFADVHRIAEGFDGFRQLAIELLPPKPAHEPASVRFARGVRAHGLLDRLRILVSAHATGVSLTAEDLQILLAVIEAHVRRG